MLRQNNFLVAYYSITLLMCSVATPNFYEKHKLSTLPHT